MSYSLVNAALLGYDLIRRPTGQQVAGVLLLGLTADVTLVQALADAHPHGRPLEERWEHAVLARRAREAAAGLNPHPSWTAELARGAVTDAARRGALAERLRHQPVGGGAAKLEALIGDDILGPGHPAAGQLGKPVLRAAADVLADSAISWWAEDLLPQPVSTQLQRPLTDVLEQHSVGIDLPFLPGGVSAMLATLENLDGDARLRWYASVHATSDPTGRWTTAMHSACWAAHLTGRTRSCAAATLLTASAFHTSDLPDDPRAGQLWNTTAGAVHAQMLLDALDTETTNVLLEPWQELQNAAQR